VSVLTAKLHDRAGLSNLLLPPLSAHSIFLMTIFTRYNTLQMFLFFPARAHIFGCIDLLQGTRRFAFNEILHSIPAIELDWVFYCVTIAYVFLFSFVSFFRAQKLFPTQWVDSTFPMWHRPPLFLGVPSANVPSVSASSAISALLQSRPEFNLTACDSTRDDLSSASVFVPKRVRHLSCTDNRVVLCEYVVCLVSFCSFCSDSHLKQRLFVFRSKHRRCSMALAWRLTLLHITRNAMRMIVPNQRHCISTGLFASSCVIYFCNGLPGF
jgi:hypothetical protein